MTNRLSYGPQDFQKLYRQAERDHESRKLLVLMERLKKQIAQREVSPAELDAPKPPVGASSGSRIVELPLRSVPFER